MDRLRSLLSRKSVLLADGATGTNYFDYGLLSGDAPELWNVDHPERVKSLHKRFIDAGADIVLTNTFGGTRYRLALHGADTRVLELNQRAAELAHEAIAESGRDDVLVAGSMGPTGEIFAPLGELAPEDGKRAFAEQAEGLAAGGADVLWLETLSSREEIMAGIEAAAEVGLPVVCTASFDTNGATMMGLTPQQFMSFTPAAHDHVHAAGTNCGVGAAEVVACMLQMRATVAQDFILVAKANCGIPRWEDGAIQYDGTPALMADYVRLAYAAGARIIGGCCGTTPDHLAVMRKALDQVLEVGEQDPSVIPDINGIEALLGPISDGIKRQLTGAEAPSKRRRSRRRG